MTALHGGPWWTPPPHTVTHTNFPSRFRLWIRYDSPEGRALVDQRDHELASKLQGLEEDLLFQVQVSEEDRWKTESRPGCARV